MQIIKNNLLFLKRDANNAHPLSHLSGTRKSRLAIEKLTHPSGAVLSTNALDVSGSEPLIPDTQARMNNAWEYWRYRRKFLLQEKSILYLLLERIGMEYATTIYQK